MWILNSRDLRWMHYLQYNLYIWPAVAPSRAHRIAPWPRQSPDSLQGFHGCPKGAATAPEELPEQI